MTLRIPSINPKSSHSSFRGARAIKVINRSTKLVPGRIVSRIAAVARQVHASTVKPVHESTYGACHDMALLINSDARKFFPDMEAAEVMRGWEIPGSDGYIPLGGKKEFRGLHHLSALYFKGFTVLVDITAAQLYKGLPQYKNTEALIVICENDKIQQTLKDIYRSRQWWFLPFGF
jgi:hypothetical protein